MENIPEKTQNQYAKLVDLINNLNYHYYCLDDPIMGDNEYDFLMNTLLDIEFNYPDIKRDDSPSYRIGDKISAKFEEVIHNYPMFSINNTFDADGVDNFLSKLPKGTPYIVEYKYDGIAIDLEYKDGVLFKASTRGDGYIGEDVTANIRTIQSVPLTLVDKKIDCNVHGEVVVTKKGFEKLNKALKSEGNPTYANTRSMVGGLIRNLDPSITKRGDILFIPYNIFSESMEFEKRTNITKFLHDTNFFHPHTFPTKTKDISNVCRKCKESLNHLPYDTDGVVIKVNDISMCEEIGYTSKYPKWALAYKWPAETGTTVVTDIITKVSRFGTLTPVAEFNPIKLDGAIVSRATLHNLNHVAELDIRIGDTICVERSGKTIPKITRAIKELRDETSKPYQPNEVCPSCGNRSVVINGSNCCLSPNCPDKIIAQLSHATSKRCFNITGLSEATLRDIRDSFPIYEFKDLFSLTIDNLKTVKRIGDKKAKNIYEAIRSIETIAFDKFLYSLSIPGLGLEVSKIIAEQYMDIKSLLKTNIRYELVLLDGIGDTLAVTIENSLDKIYNAYSKLLLHGITILPYKEQQSGVGVYYGSTFCFTGKFVNPTKSSLTKIIVENGGTVRSNISSKINYLVVGQTPGSKVEKASRFDIKLVDEKFVTNLNT